MPKFFQLRNIYVDTYFYINKKLRVKKKLNICHKIILKQFHTHTGTSSQF